MTNKRAPISQELKDEIKAIVRGGECMPKIEKLTAQQGKVELDKIKEKSPTRWVSMFGDLSKDGGAVKIEDLTRGSAWGLKRQAIAKGFDAKLTDKGTTLVITTKPKLPTQK